MTQQRVELLGHETRLKIRHLVDRFGVGEPLSEFEDRSGVFGPKVEGLLRPERWVERLGSRRLYLYSDRNGRRRNLLDRRRLRFNDDRRWFRADRIR